MSVQLKIKPMGNRIVVKREAAEMAGGKILLPESVQQKPREGVVIAVGSGKSNEKGKVFPIDVKVGDRVLFSSYGGAEYTTEETEYLILSEEDVLAVYE